jgi:hypothetical protein
VGINNMKEFPKEIFLPERNNSNYYFKRIEPALGCFEKEIVAVYKLDHLEEVYKEEKILRKVVNEINEVDYNIS